MACPSASSPAGQARASSSADRDAGPQEGQPNGREAAAARPACSRAEIPGRIRTRKPEKNRAAAKRHGPLQRRSCSRSRRGKRAQAQRRCRPDRPDRRASPSPRPVRRAPRVSISATGWPHPKRFRAGGASPRMLRRRPGQGSGAAPEAIASASSGSNGRVQRFTIILPTTCPFNTALARKSLFLTVPRGICLTLGDLLVGKPCKVPQGNEFAEFGSGRQIGALDRAGPARDCEALPYGSRSWLLVLWRGHSAPAVGIRDFQGQRSGAALAAGGRSPRCRRSGKARSRTCRPGCNRSRAPGRPSVKISPESGRERRPGCPIILATWARTRVW